MKTWIHKAASFADAETFERDYYAKMSPGERLAVVQYLREERMRTGKRCVHEGGKRLRRVLAIVEQE